MVSEAKAKKEHMEVAMMRKVSRQLQERIDAWFDRDPHETFMERIELILEAEKLYANEKDAERYGHTLQHVLENITPVVGDGPIAGYAKLRFPTAEEEKNILAAYHSWWNIPVSERHKRVLFYYSEAWIRCRPYFFASFGHLAMDWETIINVGIGGLRDKALRRREEMTGKDQKEMLAGALICYEAISDYIKRLSVSAQKEGKQKIAENLRQVAEGRAETFEQALQLIWILVFVLQKICGCGVLNLSRMDQYLASRYENDVRGGILTEDRAVELLQEFYFHHNEIMAQTDHMSVETETTKSTLEAAFDDPNYLILAGRRADGTGGVNTLSFLMVEAARTMKLRNPFIVVRWYRGIPADFWQYVCDGMRENTTIVIYNDETMIPALKQYGVEEPEVYDYGFFGCNDPTIPGCTGGLRQVWFNLAKPLELALNQGNYPMDPLPEASVRRAGDGERLDPTCQFGPEDRMIGIMTGAYYGVKTKRPEEMTSMEDVIDAYRQQVEYLMGEFRRGFEEDFRVEQSVAMDRLRIEDCFIRGTIDQGITWTEGGVKYHSIINQGCGLATVVDSLYAIWQVCFVKKEMTVAQLAKLLRDNYAGNEEQAKIWRIKLAKYGNDEEAVDKFAKTVTEIFTDAVKHHNGERYLYQMWPTYSTDRDFTTMGQYVGATPDGRRAGEPLSENQSPTNGADVSGMTALLNSVSRIPFAKITGGPLNLRIHPSAAEGEDGLNVLCALFETYMENGGMQLQINVVDADTLRRAQEQPEQYKTLCVRVTGYSAFFVEMGKKAQNELIARTEQSV